MWFFHHIFVQHPPAVPITPQVALCGVAAGGGLATTENFMYIFSSLAATELWRLPCLKERPARKRGMVRSVNGLICFNGWWMMVIGFNCSAVRNMFEYSFWGVLAWKGGTTIPCATLCNHFHHGTSGNIGKIGTARHCACEAEKASTKPFRRQLQQGFISCVPHDSDIEKISNTNNTDDCAARHPISSLLWSIEVEPVGMSMDIPVSADARATWNRLTVELQPLLPIWSGQAGPVLLGILFVTAGPDVWTHCIPTAASKSEVH